MGKCAEPHCRKSAAPKKNYCHKCRQAKWRANNPMRSSYKNLKDNAKRRGKEFTLTFEQFSKFAIEVNLIGKSGRHAEAYTVDRVDNEKGYTIDNIQMLTKSENSSKRDRKLNYDWQTKYGSYTDIPKDNEEDQPF